MHPPVIVVTEIEYRKAQPVFAGAELECVPAPDEEPGLAEAIRTLGASHAIVGARRYQDALYRALPAGGVLARFGVGHDGINKGKATAAGLLCTNTPGVLDGSVAEHALLLMLAAARHLPQALSALRDGTWSAPVGVELAGKKLAVVGWGPIGRAVGRAASLGLGMRIAAWSRSPRPDCTTDFGEAVRDADFVSLHIPAVPSTAHFLNAERLGLLAPHAWVINTARGAVLDENALYDAAANGRIAGAALDVFEHEPYRPTDPARDLRRLPNVMMTPHIGSNTAEANRRMAEGALRNIRLAIARQWDQMDLLNPEVLRRNA